MEALPVIFHVDVAWPFLATAGLGALAGADVALLGWDVYQGYRLAQAHGYFLPKAKPVPAHTTAKSIVYDWNQFIKDLQACYENYLVGSEAYNECAGADISLKVWKNRRCGGAAQGQSAGWSVN